MIDIKLIRENKKEVEKELAKKSFDFNLDHLLKIDETRTKLIREVDELRTLRNVAAEERNIERGREIKAKLEKLEPALGAIEEEYKTELFKIPNPPLGDVPVGDETKNEILHKVGKTKKFDFKPKNHLEIGEALDIIDIVRAAKVSGTRFAYLKGDGALLELALIQLTMNKLVESGFTPIFPPALIKQEITKGLGYWQVGANENYYSVRDYAMEGETKDTDLYLVGTGEHSVVPMHSGEVFKESELPKKYVAFSSCFRRESGSYGKDTHGILRVHQFDKIEMISFVKPEDDEKERHSMLKIVEEMMKELDLPYQVVKLASEDLGFPSAETIDIETWLPSEEKYRETHSISTTTNFQAKRLNIKYQDGDKKNYVHILNGTAFALGRIIIAILENYQKEDGTVVVPQALREYLRKDTFSNSK